MTDKNSFTYISNWDKRVERNDAESNVRLSGSRFEVTELKISPEYFAHRFQRVNDFEVFLERVFKFVTFPEINNTGNLTLFWTLTKSVANETLKIHPDWKDRVLDLVQRFDNETCKPYSQRF